jgi:uncharacterized membrane protein
MNGLWVKIALAVSLALNLFIGGAVAGAAFQRHRVMDMRNGPAPGNPLMRAGDGLPPDEREAYRMRMRQSAMANQALLAADRAARDRAVIAFSAPNFDPQAATTALAASRDAEVAARTQLETTVVDFAKTLDPDDRRALAQGLKQGPGRGGRAGFGGRRHNGGMGGPMHDSPPGDGLPPPGPPGGQ